MTLLRRATAPALSVCIPADSVVLKMVPSEAYGGRYSYYTASGEDAGYPSTLSGGVVPGQYVNPETNNIEKYNPYLLDFQLEWAARTDWCVNTYENCNHAPVVEMDEKDFTAAPGETVSFAAAVQ